VLDHVVELCDEVFESRLAALGVWELEEGLGVGAVNCFWRCVEEWHAGVLRAVDA